MVFIGPLLDKIHWRLTESISEYGVYNLENIKEKDSQPNWEGREREAEKWAMVEERVRGTCSEKKCNYVLWVFFGKLPIGELKMVN